MKIDKLKDSILIIVAFILGGVLTYVVVTGNLTTSSKGTTSSGGATCSSKNCTKVLVDGSGISQSVSKVYDGVAIVRNYQNNELAGFGTGFVYKEDDKYDYLITNHHVIDGADEIKVVNNNDQSVDAKLLGSDELSDLAVLSIDESAVMDVATFGKSEDVEVGDTVFTVGTPLGNEYKGTVTKGILSGKNRLVSVDTTSGGFVMEVLQTDAAINSGNSGGPLCNANGQVVGITSLKLVAESVEGMGFAIPIEVALSYAEKLENKEKITQPYLGVSMVNVMDAYYYPEYSSLLKEYKITKGVIIVSTEKGSPAAKAGLASDDIIIKINDDEVTSVAYLRYYLYNYGVGDKVEITYIRKGKTLKTTVTLGSNSKTY